jgi:HK97 family phage portal protein
LVETPNPVTTEFEQVELLSTYKDLAGINYQLIQRGRDGFPSALWPLRPDLVGVLPSARDPAVFAWVYRPNPDRPDIQVVIPSSDMVVVRNPNPNPLNPADRYFGHAPLRPAARAVSLDNAATDFVDRLLRNDATPTAVVTTSEAITAEVADRLKTRWMNRFSGVNRGGPVFLQKGMDVKPLGLNLRDLEFPDLRTISESRICMAIGRTPPILVGAKVGLDRSTFANYHEAVLSWWQGPLRSEQRRYADAMNARLVSDFTGVGRRPVLFGWDNSDVPALKEAESAKWERATNALARGGITQNDFRRTVGLPPVPGGDQFLIPAGVVPTPAGQPGEDAVSASLDLTAAEYGIELTTEERLALTAGSEE